TRNETGVDGLRHCRLPPTLLICGRGTAAARSGDRGPIPRLLGYASGSVYATPANSAGDCRWTAAADRSQATSDRHPAEQRTARPGHCGQTVPGDPCPATAVWAGSPVLSRKFPGVIDFGPEAEDTGGSASGAVAARCEGVR